DPVVGPGGKLVLRRVGSKAEPFVAEIGTQAGPSRSGFDRSEALIAGGGALGLILLGAGILPLVGRGRSGRQSQIPHGSAPTRPQPHYSRIRRSRGSDDAESRGPVCPDARLRLGLGLGVESLGRLSCVRLRD